MRTPSDGDVGKFTLFLFRVRPRPFFLGLDWLGGLVYLRYVYRAYMFVNDSDDEQATTLYKSVL